MLKSLIKIKFAFVYMYNYVMLIWSRKKIICKLSGLKNQHDASITVKILKKKYIFNLKCLDKHLMHFKVSYYQ